MSNKHCEQCGKVSHRSEVFATEAMAHMRPQDRPGLRAYECRHGNGWHLGHARAGQPKGRPGQTFTERRARAYAIAYGGEAR